MWWMLENATDHKEPCGLYNRSVNTTVKTLPCRGRRIGGMCPLVGNEEVSAGDLAARDLTDMIRELTAELIQRSQENAQLRTRLEFAQQAESTLRKQLEGEHERVKRLETDRERLLPDLLRQKDLTNAEREHAEHLEAELRKALAAQRGWLRRFFGF
jgi:chromosome segregation ATPase